MLSKIDLIVKSLGECKIASPLNLSTEMDDGIANYTPEGSYVFYQNEVLPGETRNLDIYFEKAGPRQNIFFEPPKTKAAIVTCGGLCPGLNNVIRSIFLELYHHYGVEDIIGIRYGYKGLNPANGYEPIKLNTSRVSDIHKLGGTILGSSRGKEDIKIIVDTLYKYGIDILFCVGGDGTLKGAHAIYDEITKRGYKKSIIGIPKTIDNDINYVDKTFGFDTAIGIAREVLESAHAEAKGAPNGIGLVKLMGRDSGFVAAHATLSSLEINFTLLPEVPFDLEGDNGLFYHLEKRLKEREHAVIVVAEGAGQDLIPSSEVEKDESGNIKHKDIGTFLTEKIKEYFSSKKFPFTLKYFDPSYYIRSVTANANDSIFCDALARNAVHAGMAGKTDIVIGLWHGSFTNVPIPIATQTRKIISTESELWLSIIEATGQPPSMKSNLLKPDPITK
jgi:6-phosphofructokinase 1